ncbi:MAG: ABC transporter ATP-binding protein [Oscillospiraceae bacterium]|nr:ABC transporter ATP-binding protein [Oscillospiraceae bacterium]
MIKGTNLTKKFEENIALDGINFEIEDGSIYGLVGSNGSGKSTLLRLISGVYRADGGAIEIDGESCFNNVNIKDKIAFLGDTPYFLPQSNLIDMKRFYKSVYSNFSDETFEHLLSVFPLNRNARISTMSKGMQRQAALILAMSTKPSYLLLDEAFDGLDVVMRRVLANIIIDGVERDGLTAIIASHNLRELEDIVDHIALIHNGNILFNDQSEQLKDKIHKIQVAFNNVPDTSVFDALDVMKIERTGSLLQLVVRGDKKEIMDFIKNLMPLFAECIQPTIEEIFVYELEVIGYDVKNILQ